MDVYMKSRLHTDVHCTSKGRLMPTGMDLRCGVIINNLQSSRQKAFNARQLRGKVNPKGLLTLFELYYLKSILLSYIIKLYYLKSFRVTLRHCREKEQLVELYIKVPIIV